MQVFRLWDVDPDDIRDVPEPRMVAGTVDGSDLLGPGVYVLWLGGRWVWADWAPNVLERIAIHRQLASAKTPSWMPIKGHRFDRFTWKRCPKHRSEEVLMQLKEELRVELAVS